MRTISPTFAPAHADSLINAENTPKVGAPIGVIHLIEDDIVQIGVSYYNKGRNAANLRRA